MDPKKLKVLMVSYDRNILNPESKVALRMKEYAQLVGELHIVVMAKRSLDLQKVQLGDNLWVYPTNSSTRWLYPFDAKRIGQQIVFEKKFVRGESLITTTDPFESGWVGTKIKNKWRISLEVQLHTDPFSNQFYGLLNSIRKYLAKKVLKTADHFRVVTHTLAQRINEEYGVEATKISVLPIFVDQERILNEASEMDFHKKYKWNFVLLTVARLTPEKNISFALDVLKNVRLRYPAVGMAIVGSGVLEESLKEKVKKTGLEDSVSFEGWQESVGDYYLSANAYIQTSKFEGYGVSLIEAGLYGVPIVTTPVGVATEFENEKEIYICNEGDLKAFSAAIVELIENNRQRENLKINMKEALKTKLLSKDDYLKELQKSWLNTAEVNI